MSDGYSDMCYKEEAKLRKQPNCKVITRKLYGGELLLLMASDLERRHWFKDNTPIHPLEKQAFEMFPLSNKRLLILMNGKEGIAKDFVELY